MSEITELQMAVATLSARVEALTARVAELEEDSEEQEFARSREWRRYCQERRHGGSQA